MCVVHAAMWLQLLIEHIAIAIKDLLINYVTSESEATGPCNYKDNLAHACSD